MTHFMTNIDKDVLYYFWTGKIFPPTLETFAHAFCHCEVADNHDLQLLILLENAALYCGVKRV